MKWQASGNTVTIGRRWMIRHPRRVVGEPSWWETHQNIILDLFNRQAESGKDPACWEGVYIGDPTIEYPDLKVAMFTGLFSGDEQDWYSPLEQLELAIHHTEVVGRVARWAPHLVVETALRSPTTTRYGADFAPVLRRIPGSQTREGKLTVVETRRIKKVVQAVYCQQGHTVAACDCDQIWFQPDWDWWDMVDRLHQETETLKGFPNVSRDAWWKEALALTGDRLALTL